MANALKKGWSRFGLLLVTVAFWMFFAIKAEGFLTEYNLFTLIRLASVQITIGFAQMVALSSGEMNLSVGAIGGGVAMLAGGLMEVYGLSPVWAVLLGILLAFVLGYINGSLVIRTGINSFIITLATTSVYTGLMLIITKADSFDNLPENFLNFSRIRTLGLAISPLFWIMLAIAGALYFFFNKSRYGRQLLAVGANRRAAHMSGLDTPRIILVTHIISAVIAGLAGIMSVMMLADAVPVIGTNWVLSSFAAPAIGGTAISGGYVSVFGTLIGGLLIGSITNGVLLLNVSNFFVNFFLGLILLFAVWLDQLRKTYTEEVTGS